MKNLGPSHGINVLIIVDSFILILTFTMHIFLHLIDELIQDEKMSTYCETILFIDLASKKWEPNL